MGCEAQLARKHSCPLLGGFRGFWPVK